MASNSVPLDRLFARRPQDAMAAAPPVPLPAAPRLSDLYTVDARVQGQLGVGTYGEVMRGVCKRTGAPVALKRLKSPAAFKGGVPVSFVREISCLRRLARAGGGAHWARFLGVCVADSRQEAPAPAGPRPKSYPQPQLFIAFGFEEHDLHGLLLSRAAVRFLPAHCVWLARGLVQAVADLHAAGFVNRDIKSANVLVAADGTVRLTDFGMASSRVPARRPSAAVAGPHEPCVTTLFYRAPELLLGDRNYTAAVDVWSVGCVVADLLAAASFAPFFAPREVPAPSDAHVLAEIFATFDASTWDRGALLLAAAPHLAAALPRRSPAGLAARCQRACSRPDGADYFTSDALDFLSCALALDPDLRPPCAELLRHPWLTQRAEAPADILASLPHTHELAARKAAKAHADARAGTKRVSQ
jgi:cell division cycle 2-like protein